MIIYKLILIVLFIEMIRLGIYELRKMFKGFRFDVDVLKFGICFFGLIVLYCLYS